VPSRPQWKGASIDSDSGRYKLNRLDDLMYALKTPTVRNAELTAPYMHNGVYKTLEEVVKFYNVGGGKGIGINLPNQTLPFDSLGLSPKEITAVVSFIKTLTDTSGLTGAPAALPKFSEARLNQRKIGGTY
jgi:cytochrome c peroxidase